jgi:hypothetical protein
VSSPRSSLRPPPTVALAKGTIFLNARAFVTHRFGAEAWGALVASLPSPAREALAEIVAMGWYDASLQPAVYRAMQARLGRGEPAVLRDLARFAADEDLHGIYRMFLRFASPGYVLEKGMAYWSRFQSTGEWTVHRASPTRAGAVLRGFSTADAAVCHYLAAYMARMMELAGARGVRVEHVRCRARGEAECAFDGEWSA